jgi:hypothetical protein
MKTFTAGDEGRGGVGRRPVLRGDARCPQSPLAAKSLRL